MRETIAQGVASTAQDVRAHVEANLDRFLDLTTRLVAIDSARDAPEGITEVIEVFASELSRRVPDIEIETREDEVTHLRATLPGTTPAVAWLGHADTVYPKGTGAQRPLSRHGDRVEGPGVADMKGGLVMAALALEALARDDRRPTIELVVAGDEETRIVPPPFSHVLSHTAAILVLECGRPGGGFITERKGGFWARIDAHGLPAHAGVEPERGASAILDLSRAVLAVSELDRSRAGLSVSIGTINGGSAPNVVSDRAHAELDVRSPSTTDLAAVRTEMADRVAEVGDRIEVVDVGSWPPLHNDNSARLADDYLALGSTLGINLKPEATGGMSDGCWTAGEGLPTLDGLGPEGGNDHSPEEYLDLSTVAERAGLLAGLTKGINHNHQEEEKP